MRFLLCTLCLLGISTTLSAQTLVSNGGQSIEFSSLHFSFSVGEPVIGFLSDDDSGTVIHLLQGFQQPYGAAVILPLTWLSFTGSTLSPQHHQLNWNVLHDGLNNDFSIERSSDGIQFTTLATLSGQGSAGLNATYTFDDYLASPAPWYYRIRQTDFDDFSTYSPIILLGKKDEVGQFSAYPNPASNNLNLEWSSAGTPSVHLQVFAPDGRLLLTDLLDTQGNKTLNINSWPAGIYTLRWMAGVENYRTRIIKH